MNPKSTARSLMYIASGIDRSNRPDPSLVIASLNSIIASSKYELPPQDSDKFEDWARDNRDDAIAYVANWTESNFGYGQSKAKDMWPDNPGFDWKEGLPKFPSEISEESGYEYRTSLIDGSVSSEPPKKLPDGFELVERYKMPPEEGVWDLEDDLIGILWIGDGSMEAVYRRLEE